MKITNAEIIKSGEKGLIETVTSDLNWHLIEDLLRNKYNLKLRGGGVKYTSGDIIVHNNQVAYQLDFDVTVTLSVLLNRQGECFDVAVDNADASSTATPEKDGAVDFAAAADADDNAEAVSVDAETEGEGVDDAAQAAHPESMDNDATEAAHTLPANDESPTPSQIADMIASINQGE